ncbi:unnamed protein product [Dibothriocephalus latus]|uniref:Uncharacterized protein n=1 Tax=Dibothriocephalus latus TaxID=60516 RepID=A0A3P7NKT6_DIBLA|nr:unnamed protein product [Dibothriocephalus latus]
MQRQFNEVFSFPCLLGIIYRFWLFIDPDAIKKFPEDCAVNKLILLKHASSPDSSWHFMLTYEALQNRHFAKNESQKQVFVVGARLMAPPNLLWQIDGCSADDIRLLPGRWTQVTVKWNLTHITMRFNGRICASEPLTTVQKVQQGNLFSPRNTAFVFLGRSARRPVNETLCNVRSPTYVIRDFSFSVMKPSSNTKPAEAYSFIYLQHRVPPDGIMYLQEQIEVLMNSVSRSPSNATLMNNKIQLPKTFMDNIFVTFTLLPLDRVRSQNGKTLTVLRIPELGFQVTLQRLQGNNWALRLFHAIEDEGCESVESRFYGPKVCLKVPCHFEIERGPSTNFTVVCQKERMTLMSQEMTVSKQDCTQFIGVDICNESLVSRLKNGSNMSVLHCAFNNLLPYSDVSLYFYPKPKLLEFGIIHIGAFPTLECHFTQLEAMISGEINPNALVSTDFCRLSPELSNLSINLLKVGGVETASNDDEFEQSNARDQAFPISTDVPQAHPVIHVTDQDADCIKGCNPSTAALQCFRALEFCHFGVTIAFWMVYIPSSQEEKPSTQQTWRVAELVGLSNSRLTISLAIDWTDTAQSGDGDVALTLMAELRMDRAYAPGYTVANIWKATVSPNQMKEADSKWAFVVVSWSDFGGLEVSINEQLITTGNRTLEREREGTRPPNVLSDGLYIGGLLAGFDAEDAKIPMCNIHTCIADVTCREDSERTSSSTKSRL